MLWSSSPVPDASRFYSEQAERNDAYSAKVLSLNDEFLDAFYRGEGAPVSTSYSVGSMPIEAALSEDLNNGDDEEAQAFWSHVARLSKTDEALRLFVERAAYRHAASHAEASL